MATPYDREDAARDTGVTDKEVSEAWHEARESAQQDGDYGASEWDRETDAEEEAQDDDEDD